MRRTIHNLMQTTRSVSRTHRVGASSDQWQRWRVVVVKHGGASLWTKKKKWGQRGHTVQEESDCENGHRSKKDDEMSCKDQSGHDIWGRTKPFFTGSVTQYGHPMSIYQVTSVHRTDQPFSSNRSSLDQSKVFPFLKMWHFLSPEERSKFTKPGEQQEVKLESSRTPCMHTQYRLLTYFCVTLAVSYQFQADKQAEDEKREGRKVETEDGGWNQNQPCYSYCGLQPDD